jgi:ABC-type phosphate transport system substrate-binding protein
MMACFGTAQALAAGPADPYPDPGFYVNIIGGGATFPSVVYRQILDCTFHPMGYGNVTGPGPLTIPGLTNDNHINIYCPSSSGEASQKGFLWIYYAATGSGNGKTAIKANNNNLLTDPGSTTVPYTSSQIPTFPYPQAAGYHFSGSDDIWTLADQTAWNAANGPASKFGNLVQLPAVAGAVTIVLNGKDANGTALTQNGTPVSGSSSAVNLTRQAVCGIFSGHITKWSNNLLTAQNGGQPLGSGKITVVHRPDGSGTTFLLTNGLQEQCRAVTGPNNEDDQTIVSYAFPWGDNSVCPALPRGANLVNWPDQFSSICGGTNNNPTPAGSTFLQASSNGSQGLVNTVLATPGAIGYVSPDFVKPANPAVDAPAAANLQNEWDVSTNATGTPTFVAPTVAATKAAVASVTPVFDNTSRGNPLAWSLQGVVPNPTQPTAYPLAGFTWLELYQCYNSGINIPNQLSGFIFGLYSGTGSVPSLGLQAVIESNGFAQVPDVWQAEVIKLLGDPSLAPGNTWDTTPGNPCAGKVGAT